MVQRATYNSYCVYKQCFAISSGILFIRAMFLLIYHSMTCMNWKYIDTI